VLNGWTDRRLVWGEDFLRSKKHCVGWCFRSPTARRWGLRFHAAFAKLLWPVVTWYLPTSADVWEYCYIVMFVRWTSVVLLCNSVPCRKIGGPHICGDSLDIDPMHNQILTGSWRKDNPLQVSLISDSRSVSRPLSAVELCVLGWVILHRTVFDYIWVVMVAYWIKGSISVNIISWE